MPQYGSVGSPTYSVTFNGLDDMLNAVADNSEQAIKASDMRNSLYTLWDRYSGGMGYQGFQGRQGFQGIGYQGPTGSGNQGVQGVIGIQGSTGSNGSPGLVGYGFKIVMTNGFPTSVSGASSSSGTILHDGSSWIVSGWSSSIDNLSNYKVRITHPLNKKVVNMTTHGLNSGMVYSIAVYGKSVAGTQYCTLVQPTSFAYFDLYGVSYQSTSCDQSGTSEVVVTFQS